MQRILVTGANRGLGLEFVRQYLTEPGALLFAAARRGSDPLAALQTEHGERLHRLVLDVTSDEGIKRAVTRVRAVAGGLDLLINNAGISPRGERWENLEADTMLATLRVNAIAPLLVARHFHELLCAGRSPRVINVSSMMGSLALKRSGRHYSYCSSKAALNMLTRTAAHDLKADGIVVCALHPGWVRTDMGGSEADLDPVQSVRGMRTVIAGLTLRDTGAFYTWQGWRHPW